MLVENWSAVFITVSQIVKNQLFINPLALKFVVHLSTEIPQVSHVVNDSNFQAYESIFSQSFALSFRNFQVVWDRSWKLRKEWLEQRNFERRYFFVMTAMT